MLTLVKVYFISNHLTIIFTIISPQVLLDGVITLIYHIGGI